jgi:hypothetical protein
LMLKNSPILSIWELREDGSHHKFWHDSKHQSEFPAFNSL